MKFCYEDSYIITRYNTCDSGLHCRLFASGPMAKRHEDVSHICMGLHESLSSRAPKDSYLTSHGIQQHHGNPHKERLAPLFSERGASPPRCILLPALLFIIWVQQLTSPRSDDITTFNWHLTRMSDCFVAGRAHHRSSSFLGVAGAEGGDFHWIVLDCSIHCCGCRRHDR